MAVEVVMPRLGWSAEEGSIVEWLKKDGEIVGVGEVICTVEGDKAINEVESLDSGILRIPPEAPEAGVKVPVGTVLAYLVQPGEPAPFETDLTPRPSPSEMGRGAGPSPLSISDGEGRGVRPRSAVTISAIAPVTRRDEPPISPRARRIAAELGVRWSDLKGSGRSGRIVERDVQAAANLSSRPAGAGQGTAITEGSGKLDREEAETLAPALAQGETEPDGHGERGQIAPPEAPAANAQPLTGARRIIARRMAESAHTAAPVTLTTEADATELVRLRAQMKAERAGTDEIVPGYNDLLAKVVAVTLREHPRLNASLVGETIVEHSTVNVGIAVDTERGLLVPVIHDVAAKSIDQIAVEGARLIADARSGKVSGEDLRGGTITISNLGSYEIDAFTPIVDLPECAILGVGRIVARPVVVDEASEQVAVRKMMTLSLTFDHRVVDGAPAARFLQRIKHLIEEPTVWMIRS